MVMERELITAKCSGRRVGKKPDSIYESETYCVTSGSNNDCQNRILVYSGEAHTQE